MHSSSRLPPTISPLGASRSSFDVAGGRREGKEYSDEGILLQRRPAKQAQRTSTLRGAVSKEVLSPQDLPPLQIPKITSADKFSNVSPARPLPGSISPNMKNLMKSLQQEVSPKSAPAERRLSNRTEKEWRQLSTDQIKKAYEKEKSDYSRILVCSVLDDAQFEVVKSLFLEAAKNFLKDCSEVTRKNILREFEQKGHSKRIENLAKVQQLPRFDSYLTGNDELRKKTLSAIPITVNEEQLKILARAYLENDKFISLEKILREIFSLIREERAKKESSQSHIIVNYSKFIVCLIAESDSTLVMGSLETLGDLKSHYVEVNSDYYKTLVINLDKVVRKHKEAYAAKEFIKELCKADKPDSFINDIAYGYPWFTSLERLVSTICIAYATVTPTVPKRVLMLKLLIEILRVSYPKTFEAATEDALYKTIQAATSNDDEMIRELGRELVSVREDNRRALVSGKWESPSPRLMERRPSLLNLKAAQLTDSQKSKTSQLPASLKYEDFVQNFIKGNNVWADQLQRVAIDLRSHAFSMLKKIHLMECAGKMEPHNLKLFVEYSNSLSDFVKKQILDQEDIHPRAKMIELFILLASSCEKKFDFHSAQAIVLAIANQVISRLKKTWDHVSFDLKAQFDVLQETYFNRGFSKLRDLINVPHHNIEAYVRPSCITQMDFELCSSVPKFTGKQVNLDGLKVLAQISFEFLDCIRRIKSTPPPTTEIIKCITDSKRLTDEELDALSKKREPSSKKKKESDKTINASGSGSNIFKQIFSSHQ